MVYKLIHLSVRNLFYFSIKQHVFSYSRKKTYGFLVGRYYVDTIKLVLTFEKKEEMDDLQDPIHIQKS